MQRRENQLRREIQRRFQTGHFGLEHITNYNSVTNCGFLLTVVKVDTSVEDDGVYSVPRALDQPAPSAAGVATRGFGGDRLKNGLSLVFVRFGNRMAEWANIRVSVAEARIQIPATPFWYHSL